MRPRLGMKRNTNAKAVSNTFKFKKYMTAMPAPPDSATWSAKVLSSPEGPYQMDGNDQYGDCEFASAMHGRVTFLANANPPIVQPDVPYCINQYLQLSGGDNGLEPLTMLDFWRKTGIGKSHHKIHAYGTLDPDDSTSVMQAISAFGGIFWTLELPDACYKDDAMTIPWVYDGPFTGEWAPDPNLGHGVWVPDYTSSNSEITGMSAVTWGEVKPMNYPFFEACNYIPYVVIDKSWIESGGVAPSGFDMEQLDEDLAAL